jgi:hypothetical protein
MKSSGVKPIAPLQAKQQAGEKAAEVVGGGIGKDTQYEGCSGHM